MLTLCIQGLKAREKGRVLAIMGWFLHPTKQGGLETSSYNLKLYFHRMHSRTGFLIIGCKMLLSWSKVVSYSFLFHYGALNYFNVYMANGVFPRVFFFIRYLKVFSLFYVFGWIVTCTLQGWRRLNSRLKYKEKFKEKLKWKIEILISFQKITIFRSN